MNIYGFNWRVGRSWGVVHPEHICYNGEDSVFVNPDMDLVQLGIEHNPKEFEVNGEKKMYDWSVGYISSLETIKYGCLNVIFKLPVGKNVWPAIWLYDCETWPPEIDIIEGWTDAYNWSIFKPNSAKRMYRTNPFANRIFPTLHLGTTPDEHWSKSYTKFRGTCPSYIDVTDINTCTLIWTKFRILVYYNSRLVMNEDNPEILKYFNNSKGMNIHLNNYVTNNFTMDDYKEMEEKSGKEYNKQFRILGLTYDHKWEDYI